MHRRNKVAIILGIIYCSFCSEQRLVLVLEVEVEVELQRLWGPRGGAGG